MSLSVLIIGFLISTSYFNTLNVKAIMAEKNDQYKIDSNDEFVLIWNPTEVISTESTDYSYRPSLAVDYLGNVHVAWYDHSNYGGSGTDDDIFYKRWNASTSSWTTTEVVSTESSDVSWFSSLAVDSTGTIHVAWEDSTDYDGSGGDSDIFYKHATLTHPPTIELAFILPNPTEVTNIYLDWNDFYGIYTYYIYRSSSYIWSVDSLTPIDTVYSSDYIDTVPSEGIYYYVIVAENTAGNSSQSNCQFVEVIFPDLDSPELAPILPNPTDLTSISLQWNDVDGATEYYVYRSNSYIWSVESLTPIDTVGSNIYLDTLPSEGFYFYVIVATDGVQNSTHSNCDFIEYELPHVQEFVIISSLIIGAFVLMFVVTRIRKKKPKQN